MIFCVYPYVDWDLGRAIANGMMPFLAALPVLLACILLNRLIFNSADMINGAING